MQFKNVCYFIINVLLSDEGHLHVSFCCQMANLCQICISTHHYWIKNSSTQHIYFKRFWKSLGIVVHSMRNLKKYNVFWVVISKERLSIFFRLFWLKCFSWRQLGQILAVKLFSKFLIKFTCKPPLCMFLSCEASSSDLTLLQGIAFGSSQESWCKNYGTDDEFLCIAYNTGDWWVPRLFRLCSQTIAF